MDVAKLIAELKEYKSQIDDAIAVLERLANGRVGAKARIVSPETKRKMALAQRKRWSKYRKTKKEIT
jgi:hypothetical protein